MIVNVCGGGVNMNHGGNRDEREKLVSRITNLFMEYSFLVT